MKTWSVTLLIWTVLLVAARGDDQNRNLAVNGGFEEGEAGGPAGWVLWSREEGAATARLDTTFFHSGTKSLRVAHTGLRDWSVAQSDRLDVKPGDIYEMSAWVKCEGVQNAVGVSVVLRGDDPKPIQWMYGRAQSRGTHDWREITSHFVIPPEGKSIELRLTGAGPGKVWFDDVSLHCRGNIDDLRRDLSMKSEPISLRNSAIEIQFDPKDGTFAVTDSRIGRTWTQQPSSDAIVVEAHLLSSGTEKGLRLKLLHLISGKNFEALVSLTEAAPEFSVEISNYPGEMAGPISFPAPFVCQPGDWLVVPLNEGILYPADDETVKPPSRLVGYSGHGLSMPWFGITDMKKGMMAIIESPDDMSVAMDRDKSARLFIAPSWESSLGELRYPRRIRYIFFDEGGYVAQAKEYRKRLIEAGRFKSLTQKREENPSVDLLIGAPDVWTTQLDPVQVTSELKDAGVERLMFCFHGRAPVDENRAEQIEKIKALGYLVTRYDSYRTAWPVGQPEYAFRHFETPERIAKNPDGSLRKGWLTKTKRGDYPGYEVCSAEQIKEAMQTIPADLKNNKYLGRFIDTTTASQLMECYDEKHPIARTEDKQNKYRLLQFVSEGCRLITGSETGQDWAAPVVHYFEGMMSLTPYRVPDSGRNMYQYHEPTEDLLKYQIGPGYRVPLWELVYHDSVVAVWYWGDGSNKQPELWDARDLWNILYGTPPLWMINREKWATEKDRYVKSYKDVCPMVRKAGYAEMTNHEFLTPDHTVQRTTFSNGVRITANFGKEKFRAEDGRTVDPMGRLVEGG